MSSGSPYAKLEARILAKEIVVEIGNRLFNTLYRRRQLTKLIDEDPLGSCKLVLTIDEATLANFS